MWHAVIGEATTADSICDRLVHNAHRIKLTAKESVRKERERKERLTSEAGSAK
jgi:DNA replication protein DnaC